MLITFRYAKHLGRFSIRRLQVPAKLGELSALPVVPPGEPAKAPGSDTRHCLSPSDCDHACEGHIPPLNSVRNWPKSLITPKSNVLKSPRGTPCLNPRLQWFGHPRVAPCSPDATSSRTTITSPILQPLSIP
ncbi:hypothetical protein AHF37_09812 [Paragonimus kellicotti]|nr:hypothetical protein AHF37_09812 [Paragonimus kellicotti]